MRTIWSSIIVGCMAVCHAGHDAQLLGYGRSFCDCGAGSCSLSLQSQELAEQCLVGNTRSSMGLDEEGRILGTKESNLVITPFEVLQYHFQFFNCTIAVVTTKHTVRIIFPLLVRNKLSEQDTVNESTSVNYVSRKCKYLVFTSNHNNIIFNSSILPFFNCTITFASRRFVKAIQSF
jgi:hypothetical protein